MKKLLLILIFFCFSAGGSAQLILEHRPLSKNIYIGGEVIDTFPIAIGAYLEWDKPEFFNFSWIAYYPFKHFPLIHINPGIEVRVRSIQGRHSDTDTFIYTRFRVYILGNLGVSYTLRNFGREDHFLSLTFKW